MADLGIFTITGNTSSLPPFSRYGLYDSARSALVDAVADIGRRSLFAAKTFVPRRHRELQNAIQLKRTAGSGDLNLRVMIVDGHRNSSDTPDQLFNVQLAELLDEGVQRRQVVSQNVIRYQFQNGPSGRRNQREFRGGDLPQFLRQYDSDRFGDFPKKRGRRVKTKSGWRGAGEPTKNWIGEAQAALIESLL